MCIFLILIEFIIKNTAFPEIQNSFILGIMDFNLIKVLS